MYSTPEATPYSCSFPAVSVGAGGKRPVQDRVIQALCLRREALTGFHFHAAEMDIIVCTLVSIIYRTMV
jgi:hypothetical protein